MKIKRLTAVISVLCAFFLCGCWDSKEPSNLAMITCVVMDINEDGRYDLYTELLDTLISEASEPPEGKKSFHKSSGNTLSDAVYEAANNYGREIFGGVNKIRIFSERYAERGFIDALDFFLRAPYTDETPHLIIYKSDNDISEFFETKPMLDTLYGSYFENLAVTEIKETSMGSNITILDFIKDYMTEGKQPVAGVLETKVNDLDPETKIFSYEGLSVFKNDKLVGYLNGVETRAYNILMQKAKGFSQTVTAEDGKTITAQSGKTKSKIKVKFENGIPKADIKIKMQMTLTQQPTLLDTDNFATQHKIEKMFSEKFTKEFTETIERVKTEYGSDIFGFGNSVMSDDYKTWQSIRDEWDDVYFPLTEINVNVECKIEHSGQINRSIEEKEQ